MTQAEGGQAMIGLHYSRSRKHHRISGNDGLLALTLTYGIVQRLTCVDWVSTADERVGILGIMPS